MKKKTGGSRKKVWCESSVHKVDSPEDMRKVMGPGAVDQMVRHALQFCWMMMPDSSNKAEAVEQEFRRIVDRALRDQREDQGRFPPTPGN